MTFQLLSITKLQNLKAIHNWTPYLCCFVQLLSITKLQNLKAIHNLHIQQLKFSFVVINHKTTKFESNSQLPARAIYSSSSCYQSQNYKIWKQFTTSNLFFVCVKLLLSITKLQNLKAIHNWNQAKNSWKIVVINHKTTKFESNSQRKAMLSEGFARCYQSQNYKIWKQFTTGLNNCHNQIPLLSITKLQNLKAIHNRYKDKATFLIVVINHKTTKFESNSQPSVGSNVRLFCCYQSQNYKIWKQFTTKRFYKLLGYLLLSITKLQNLKAIHNTMAKEKTMDVVVINHKTTKFESNSQQTIKLWAI